MRYKIKDIPDVGLVVDQALPGPLVKDALEGVDADLSKSAAAVHLELLRAHDDVLVRGRLSGTLSLPCVACLGPARVDVKVPINAIFRPEDEEATAEDTSEDPLEDLEIGHHDGKELDLTEFLREQLILAVPMAPHCREGCRGLCPTCGQNLNERDCGHRPAGGEKPFAALKDLKLE